MDSPQDGFVFRNSRFISGFVQFGGVMAYVLAVMSLVGGIYRVVETPGTVMHRVGGIIGVLVMFGILLLLGYSMWSQGKSMAFNEAQFNADGLRFQLGTKDAPKITLFAWDQIVGVYYKLVINTQYASVAAADGTTVGWSNYTFFRTKKLAKLIAERTGQTLKPQE